MRTQISGKQIDIGEALQTHVRTELDAVLEKFPFRPTDALVVFSRDAHLYAVEAVIHLSTGLSVKATDRATDIYAAFDGARAKMEKQLRRYKRRLKDHHRDREQPVELSAAASYILAGSGAEEAEEADEPESLQPVIVAEMEARIPALSVGEAVMQMELEGASVLVFRNERHGSDVNVVYRRDDGNIGWIDPNTLD